MINELTQETFIKNALEYYDKFQININNIVENTDYLKWNTNAGNSEGLNEVSFYDKNKKLILTSRYEFMGIFIPNTNTWKWAWAIPSLYKNSTYISRQILNYAFDLDFKNDYLLRAGLINSTIKIYDEIQLDIHVAIGASLSKKPFIYKHILIPTENENEYFKVARNFDEKIYKNYIVLYMFILDYTEKE